MPQTLSDGTPIITSADAAPVITPEEEQAVENYASKVGTFAENALIRYLTPIIVTAVAGALLHYGGVTVPVAMLNAYVPQILGAVIGALYTLVVRFLETRVHPNWGWLLGKVNKALPVA